MTENSIVKSGFWSDPLQKDICFIKIMIAPNGIICFINHTEILSWFISTNFSFLISPLPLKNREGTISSLIDQLPVCVCMCVCSVCVCSVCVQCVCVCALSFCCWLTRKFP